MKMKKNKTKSMSLYLAAANISLTAIGVAHASTAVTAPKLNQNATVTPALVPAKLIKPGVLPHANSPVARPVDQRAAGSAAPGGPARTDGTANSPESCDATSDTGMAGCPG